MPGHYRSAPAGAFGKKRPFLPIPDPQAACIWAALNTGTHALAQAEHEMKTNGVAQYVIKFVTPKILSNIRDSYKLMGRNVSGPLDRLVGALEKANRRL